MCVWKHAERRARELETPACARGKSERVRAEYARPFDCTRVRVRILVRKSRYVGRAEIRLRATVLPNLLDGHSYRDFLIPGNICIAVAVLFFFLEQGQWNLYRGMYGIGTRGGDVE